MVLNLMNRRYLWLRSQRQWAAMRVRNGIIFAIHNSSSRVALSKLIPPFTPNAAEGVLHYLKLTF